jgi:hypothetical protein
MNQNLSRLQRRSILLSGISLIFTAALTILTHVCFKRYHPAGALAWLFALLPSLPFLGIVLIATRYLARETDEFIRTQALFAMLQGSLITLVFTVIYGFLQDFLNISGPPAMAYVDIFIVATMFSLAFRIRSAQ